VVGPTCGERLGATHMASVLTRIILVDNFVWGGKQPAQGGDARIERMPQLQGKKGNEGGRVKRRASSRIKQNQAAALRQPLLQSKLTQRPNEA
jgi:hypothetical protein